MSRCSPSFNVTSMEGREVEFIGLLGLALFAGIALRRAIYVLQISNKAPERARLELVIFLAAIVATMVESLTHQLFRTRELWLVLAIQEAVLYQMITSETQIIPAVHTTQKLSRNRAGLLVQSDAVVKE